MADNSRIDKRCLPVMKVLFLFAMALAFCFPLMRDIRLSCSGDWDYFASLYEVPSISIFEYGQFPLWNPYCGGGMPLIGNPQAGFPSLTFVIASLFGVIAGLKLSVLIHTFLGLWGMWLLAGHLEMKGPARLVTSLLFIFSGSWPLHLAAGHVVWLPAAFLPFLFLSFLKSGNDLRFLPAAAVVESLMFYEGGTYVLAYALLFLGVFAVCRSFEAGIRRPFLVFTAMNGLAAALSAPKLLPVLETLAGHPRPSPPGGTISWDNYLYLFIERVTKLGANLWETCSYIGITAVVLFLLSLSMARKQKSLVASSLFMVLVSLGNFGEYSPWNILHHLPLFSGFHVPTRSLIVVCFSIALLVGLFLNSLEETPGEQVPFIVGLVVIFYLEFSPWKITQGLSFWDGFRHPAPELLAFCALIILMTGLSLREPGRSRPGRYSYLVGLVVIVVGFDLCAVNSPVFGEAAKAVDLITVARLFDPAASQYPRPHLVEIPPKSTTGFGHSVPSVHQPFSQVRIPGLDRYVHGAYSDQYLPMLQNRGVVDAYETIPIGSHARAVSDKDYRGEYHLLGEGKVSLLEWGPNRFRYHVALPKDDRLVINQNFWPGWRTSRGNLIPHEGLLAVDLPSGSYDVTVRYLPRSFCTGVLIFLLTATGMVVALLVGRKRPTAGHWRAGRGSAGN